jgi:hypothetical protein
LYSDRSGRACRRKIAGEDTASATTTTAIEIGICCATTSTGADKQIFEVSGDRGREIEAGGLVA